MLIFLQLANTSHLRIYITYSKSGVDLNFKAIQLHLVDPLSRFLEAQSHDGQAKQAFSETLTLSIIRIKFSYHQFECFISFLSKMIFICRWIKLIYSLDGTY